MMEYNAQERVKGSMKEFKAIGGSERQNQEVGISCVWDEKQLQTVQKSKEQYETV